MGNNDTQRTVNTMKTKYNNVYFRIEAGYQWGEGYTEEQAQAFKEEVIAIFESDGWTISDREHRSYSPVATKGKQSLYLHPMSFSGEVLEYNIAHIETILSNAKSFKCYHTDIYNEVFDMTRDEYLALLSEQHEEITKDLLAILTTKRSNLYISQTYSVIGNVSKKYDVKQLDKQCQNLAEFYVSQVFNELIEQQRIVTANTKNGTGFRTANTKEIKAISKAVTP